MDGIELFFLLSKNQPVLLFGSVVWPFHGENNAQSSNWNDDAY